MHTVASATRPMRFARATLWAFTLLIAIASWRLLIVPRITIGPTLLHHLDDRPVWFFLHVGFSPIALALLPLQFSAKIRKNRLQLHRWAGRLYGLSIALGASSGMVLALTTITGPLAASGFFFLDIAWFAATAAAIYFAMARQIARHRRWMIRSAALTLAAVTLRLYLPFGELMFGIEVAYPFIAWLCWVPNLIFAEWWLRRQAR